MASGTPRRGTGASHARACATGIFQTDPNISISASTWNIAIISQTPALILADGQNIAVAPYLLGLPSPAFVLGNYWPQTAAVAASSGAAPIMTDDESDIAMQAPLARASYGVSGAGITIGILSDSFNVLGGMAADEADGNLPANVDILREGPGGSHDEGRAMADLLHKIAPGAQIDFYSATVGEAGFAAGIAALTAAGCNIVVDDVAYLDEPFFQDGGPIQTAVENAIASGVSYFTAASNEGTDYIQQAFDGVRATLPGLPAGATVQNFASGGAVQPYAAVTVPTGGDLVLDMQWDQPFAGIGDSAGSANSLGLALYSLSGQLLAAASANCVGGNPDQTLTFQNTTGSTAFRLVVWQNGGSAAPGLFKIINYGNGSIAGNGSGVGSGTVIGQEMVPGANTVGAVAWSNTPAFGGSGAIEPYSSVGAGEILFDASGNRLAVPESTAKVDFTAPDGSLTSVLAPFYGTSAAAPGAAAVAALVLQADPSLSPAQLSAVLADTAVGGGGSTGSGAGLIDADAAVKLALSLAHGTAF